VVSRAAGPAPAQVVIEATGLRKSYGTITAVDGVDIKIRAGEISAIVGDNGAGKSTLVRMLCGATHPDAGEIRIDGEPVQLHDPLTARKLGIETVFQDLALVPNRDVVANLFLSREIYFDGPLAPLRILNRGAMRRSAEQHVSALGVNIPRLTGVPIERLSGGQRQAVAVARAAVWARRVMFMDEPTAALGIREAEQVLKLARRIADGGVGIVLISHILPHVMQLADRVFVMRHGRIVAELTEEISSEKLIGLIVGMEV
jgi:simple sugar transport system ATP-binding protein